MEPSQTPSQAPALLLGLMIWMERLPLVLTGKSSDLSVTI